MVAPTAVLMLLDGVFAPVPVTTEAFQLPSGTGSVSGSFLVAEHTVGVYLIGSLSLPELSRQISSTPLYFDFASSTVKGISPVDGGFYLAPGLNDQQVYVGTDNVPTSVNLRFSDDDFGHILPPPAVAGESVWIEIRAADGKHAAWAGSVQCTSQSSAALPPSLSLKELRAIVKFEDGAVRALIPESTISMSISILGLFMSIFYLVVVATQTEDILISTKENTRMAMVGDLQGTPLRLFLMNGPTNRYSPPRAPEPQTLAARLIRRRLRQPFRRHRRPHCERFRDPVVPRVGRALLLPRGVCGLPQRAVWLEAHARVPENPGPSNMHAAGDC